MRSMLSRPHFENGCDACVAKAVRTSPNLAWDPHVSTKNDITCTFRGPECWSNCCHIRMSRLCHVYVTLVLQLCAILTTLERAKQHSRSSLSPIFHICSMCIFWPEMSSKNYSYITHGLLTGPFWAMWSRFRGPMLRMVVMLALRRPSEPHLTLTGTLMWTSKMTQQCS